MPHRPGTFSNTYVLPDKTASNSGVFQTSWSRRLAGEPLQQPLEQLVAQVIEQHPEYHAYPPTRISCSGFLTRER